MNQSGGLKLVFSASPSPLRRSISPESIGLFPVGRTAICCEEVIDIDMRLIRAEDQREISVGCSNYVILTAICVFCYREAQILYKQKEAL
jgi:hypothetical protein